MVTKFCPGCEKQVHVAHKTCTCGHSFRKTVAVTQAERRSSGGGQQREDGEADDSASAGGGGGGGSRRRAREKPKFYDSSQYQRQPRKRKPRSDTEPAKSRPDVKKLAKPRREERGRSGESEDGQEPTQEPVYEDILADATKDEMQKYGVILSSINVKLAMVQEFLGYTGEDLMSDIGSNIGLLLGLSAFTIISLVERSLRTLLERFQQSVSAQAVASEAVNQLSQLARRRASSLYSNSSAKMAVSPMGATHDQLPQ